MKPGVIDAFADARVDIFRGNTLEPSDLPEAVLVFGGDGAVNRVLPALAYSGVPLLVVPCGSANDFAHCNGVYAVEDALAAWQRFLSHGDNVRTLDMGTILPMAAPVEESMPAVDSLTFADAEGRIARPDAPLGPVIMRHHLRRAETSAEVQRTLYFSNIAGIGLDAETNRLADHMPGWLRRHGGYMLAALRALFSYRAPMVRLHCFDSAGGETTFEGPVLFASIGNAPVYGSGIRMLPRAQMSDGELDLCFVPQLPLGKVLRNIHKIYSGRHVEVEEVSYRRTVQTFVESEEALEIWADGELLCHTPAEIAVAPHALRLIVPG